VQQLAAALQKREIMHTVLKSNTKTVTVGDDRPFVIIGEKLNPTGIKKLGQALVDQNFDYVKYLAQRQVAWGADVLDVNVGHPQIDEAAIIPKVVEAILSVVDVPLCIDSNEPKILEAGLKFAPGNLWSTLSMARTNNWRRSCPLSRIEVRQ